MKFSKIPGEAMLESQLFQPRIILEKGKQRMIGFIDPEGKYYELSEDEQLVQIKNNKNADRDAFIRKNGKDIPFHIWKQGK